MQINKLQNIQPQNKILQYYKNCGKDKDNNYNNDDVNSNDVDNTDATAVADLQSAELLMAFYFCNQGIIT